MSFNTVFWNIANLAGSTILTRFLRIFRGFLVAKFLGPELMGVWSALFLLLMYGENLNLGVHTSLTREIPLERGRGNHDQVKKLKNNALSFTVFLSGLSLIAMSLICLFWSSPRVEMNHGLKAIIFLMMSQQWIVCYRYLLQAQNEFRALSRYQFLYAFLGLAGAFLIIPFAFAGQLWGLILSDAVYLFVLFRYSGLDFKL